MIQVGLLCTDISPTARPLMSSVVSILEGKSNAGDFFKSGSDTPKTETKSVNYRQVQEQEEESFIESQVHSDGPWSTASTSVPDLYPANPDSGYWQKRE